MAILSLVVTASLCCLTMTEDLARGNWMAAGTILTVLFFTISSEILFLLYSSVPNLCENTLFSACVSSVAEVVLQ